MTLQGVIEKIKSNGRCADLRDGRYYIDGLKTAITAYSGNALCSYMDDDGSSAFNSVVGTVRALIEFSLAAGKPIDTNPIIYKEASEFDRLVAFNRLAQQIYIGTSNDISKAVHMGLHVFEDYTDAMLEALHN